MLSERFDSKELRHVLGAFVTGVTVVTTVDAAGNPFGLTVNSFSSVSLNPPLILWSQSLTAPSYPVFRDAEHFAISILAEHQSDISQRFASAGPNKFAGVELDLGINGIPLISGAAAHLECRRVTSYPGGDHAVFLGEVKRVAHSVIKPLVFGRGKYLVTTPRDLGEFSLDLGISSLKHLQAVRMATPIVRELATTLQETVSLGVWGNHGPTVICWEESPRPVSPNLRTGLVLPVLTSATGLAFAAHLPPELTKKFIESEMGTLGSAAGFTTYAALEATLSEIREDGLSRVTGTDQFPELYDVPINALSAPIFDDAGVMVLALTAVGHSDRLDASANGTVARALRSAAGGLSRRLGFEQ